MKNLIAALIFLATSVVIAQETIKKDVGEFSTLKVYDLINVEMIKSKKNKIEISGRNREDVVIVNKKGVLKIRMKLEESYDGKNTNIKLYYTSVDVIDANEGAIITSDDTIKQFEIELKAQEGGKINIHAKTTEATIKAVTGGVIELSGKSKNQDISINTGGVFKGKEFKTENANLAVRAGGAVDVYASEILDVKIRAGGDVFIYGDPNTVNKSKALGGRIKRMD
jgi:hypothetical protein